MILLSQLLGQDSVSLRTAATTGKVKGVRIAGNRITHVELTPTTIPAAAVRSFEGDVLTYDHDDVPLIEAIPTGDPRKRMVLDTDGDAHGTIVDLELESDGSVSTVITSENERLDGSRLLVIGDFAAIVETAL